MIGHAVLAGREVAVSDDILMRIVATAPENAREAAFRELVQRHGDALRGFLARYVKCPAEIDDLAQEALLRVYLARERYVAGGAQFRTWLLKIARNLALDVCRRSVRRKLRALGDDEGELDCGAAREPGPGAAMVEDEENAQVRAAIASLPDADREAILLRFEQNMAYDEIAKVVGGNPATIRQRVFRALKKIRDTMEHAS